MPACRRNLHRPLDVFLSHDIAEVQHGIRRVLHQMLRHIRFKQLFARQMIENLLYMAHRVNCQIVSNQGRFLCISLRQEQLALSRLLHRHRHRERALDGAQLSAQADFSDKHAVIRQLLLDVPLRRQQPQQNRQVIHRAFLANVRRCQIHRLARRQQRHADAARRRRDAFLGFLDRRARQTDQLKRRQAVDQPAFDGHEISFYAVNARGKYSCYHAHTPPVFVFYIVTQPKSLGNITAQL